MDSLFDEPEWVEVPAARFLSWPEAQQRVYCAARDLDSAEHAETKEWLQFYLDRRDKYLDNGSSINDDLVKETRS